MSAGDDVLSRHDELKALRAYREPRLRQIARILRPDDDFADPTTMNDRDDGEIFDSDPLYALDAFIGGIYSQLTNPTNRWFEMGLEDDDLARWGPVKDWLWRQTTKLLKSLAPGVSKFYAEAPAWFADVGAFGFGNLSQEELVGQGRINDRAVPLRQCYIDVDANGDTSDFHNAFAWRGKQVRQFFKGAAPAHVRDDGTYRIVHAVHRNPEHQPGRLGWKYMPWRGCFVSPDLRDLRVEGGYNELPYHGIEWNRISGRIYPTGPGDNARADMNMLQEMERSHIVAAQHAAEPILLQRGEVLSAADIVPNALLDGTINERGDPMLRELERKSQIHLSMAQSQQRRDAIRQAFMFSLMQLLARPQMTATEFLGFQSETLKLAAPGLTRVQGGLSSFLARRYAILDRAGAIDPPPQELEGHAATINFVSPLAKVQKLDEGRATVQFQQIIEQFAVTDPQVRDNFDGDAASQVVHESLFLAPGVLRDPRAVQQIRATRAAEQQQLAGLEKAGAAVSIAAEASHAAQAASAAADRGGGGAS